MLETHQPFLKRLSPEERKDILYKAVAAAERGDDDEYDRLSFMFPVNPQSANDLKKSMGIEALISTGMNLIEAVDENEVNIEKGYSLLRDIALGIEKQAKMGLEK